MNLLRTATSKIYNKVVSHSNGDEEENDDEENDRGNRGTNVLDAEVANEWSSNRASASAGVSSAGSIASTSPSSSSFRSKFERKKSALLKKKSNAVSASGCAEEDKDVKDVMFDETLDNERMLAKMMKEFEAHANDAKTRDAFVRLLMADARNSWDAKKVVDKVETPGGKIAVGVGRCGHPWKVLELVFQELMRAKEKFSRQLEVFSNDNEELEEVERDAKDDDDEVSSGRAAIRAAARMCASERNRRIFLEMSSSSSNGRNVLQEMSSIAKFSASKLRGISVNEVDGEHANRVVNALFEVCVASCEAILWFADPDENRWKEDKHAPNDAFTAVSTRHARLLFESNAVSALVEVMKAARIARARFSGVHNSNEHMQTAASLTPSDVQLKKIASSIECEFIALRAIGCAVMGDENMASSANTNGALDVVLEGTGRMPTNLLEDTLSGETSLKTSLLNKLGSLSLASSSVSREISRKSARASEAKDRAVAGALAVAVTCSTIDDDDDANIIMDSAFTTAASFITKNESDEVALQIVNVGSSIQSSSISKKSALKLRAGLARFVIHTFNRHSKEEEQEESGEYTVNTNNEIVMDAIIDANVWETLLNSETFGEVPTIDGGGESTKDEDEETYFAREETILLVGLALDNKRAGDENALQHILSAFCQRVFHPSACEALAGALLRIVYRNNPRDCRALIELEAPNRIAAAVHSQVRVWMCPRGMFVFGDMEETVEGDAKTKCARACAELLQALAKETEDPSLRLASARSSSLLTVLFDDFLWVNDESLEFASSLATYIAVEQTRTADSELFFDIDAFFLWIKAFFQALPKARIFDRESDTSKSGGVLIPLLKSIRNIAKRTPRASVRKCQNWATIENGALFLTLASLCDGESGEMVASTALETIHYAIKTSADAAQAFEQSVGYDALIEAMRIDERGKCSFASEVTLMTALRFACDDDSIDENSFSRAHNTTLRNPGALRIAFSIARNSERCSKSSQLFLLRFLAELLERSVASRECATKADALTHLFEWWCNFNEEEKGDAESNVHDATCVENIAKCIESCAAHCLTALQLRHAMKTLKQLRSSEYKRLLIDALKRAAINDAPRNFFDFAGGASGGVHVKRKVAECSNGVTVSMWIRAEIEEEKNEGSAAAEQGIFSLLTEAGVGLCCSLRPDGALKLSSLLPNGERHDCSFYDTSCPIIPGKWTHVFVSIKGGGLILGGRNASASNANARICVDGNESYPQKLKYPWNRANVATSVAQSIANTAVGDPILPNSSYDGNKGTVSLHIGAAAGIANFARPFTGQFATFRVFSEAVDFSAALLLYALGAEYVGAFMPTEAEPSILLLRKGIPISAAKDIFEKSLRSSLKLTLDATAATGNMRTHRNLNVIKGSSENDDDDELCTRVCNTTSAADVCRSLGGAEHLIPDLLEQQKTVADDLKVLPAAVSLIAALLSDGGYPLRAREKIIALTAHSITPNRLSKELIPAFDWLAKSCAGQQPRVKHGAVQTPEWLAALGDARSEIFNPVNWAKSTCKDARAGYIDFLRSNCSNAELLRVLPVRRIVRALEKFCPAEDDAFRKGLFEILENILMDETIDIDGVYCIDAIESLCAAASRSDAHDGFLVDCLAFLRRASKTHRFCFELVSNCGGFAIALAPMLLPNATPSFASERKSDSAMAARILHLAFSLPETASPIESVLGDNDEDTRDGEEKKPSPTRGHTKAIENIKNALKSLALKATPSSKNTSSAAEKEFGTSESERRMDFAAANGAIDALGEALFGQNNKTVVNDESSQIREALVELAIDGDDVNVKIKHPKAFAYFLRVTKSSNCEKYAHAKLLLSSLLDSHENNAKALSQCKADISECLDAENDPEDARILDIIPDAERKKKDLSMTEDANQTEDEDWEDVSAPPAFAIQITQVEANIDKCDKRIADEQFAVEENEGSLRRLLFGLKARWQKAQDQVFASNASMMTVKSDHLDDGLYVLDCDKEDSIGRRLRVRRDRMDALTRQISKSNTLANSTMASKGSSSEAQEENLPILQSAAKQWKDKVDASVSTEKPTPSKSSVIIEDDELDGDLTESDEDEETIRNELERLREEEVNEKSKLLDKQKTAEWLHSKADEAKREKDIFFTVSNVSMVSSSDLVIEGTLDVAKDVVFFTANRDAALDSIDDDKENIPSRFWKWPVNTIVELVHMRWRLRNVAVEMYTKDGRSVFFAFANKKLRVETAMKIASLDATISILDRRQKARTAHLMQKRWKDREISTFDYLIALNKLAGRTYHDLSQYPVFPWILSDYESATINLEDPKVYRDLSLPIGALNPVRLKQFIERFKQLESDPDAAMPAFHYGSHYSSAAIVLYFLIRLEPFTNLSRQLQGGKFDHPDRLFSDISQTWKAVLESTADVKELIPEFFYLPEFLENNNSNVFGKRQDGSVVDNVVLPKWANGSTRTFIQTMRDALESDHVSHTIHDWIDLVFGASQLGARAKSKKNVFYYLTYEGAVDLDAIEDPQERLAIETQIVNFGQTPAQVFKRPHPRRIPRLRRKREAYASVYGTCLRIFNGEDDTDDENDDRSSEPLKLQGIFQDAQFNGDAIVQLSYDRDKLVAVSSSRKIWTARVVREGHKLDFDFQDQNARITLEPINSANNSTKDQPCRSIARDMKVREQIIGSARMRAKDDRSYEGENPLNANGVATLDGGRVAVVSGFWDGTIRAYAGDEPSGEIACSKGHRDIVECLAMDLLPHPSKPWRLDFTTDGGHAFSGGSISAVQHRVFAPNANKSNVKYGYLVSGGADASVGVWEIVSTPNGFGLPVLPKLQKFGHSDAIVSIAVNASLDIVVSGSLDGTCLLHDLNGIGSGGSSNSNTNKGDRKLNDFFEEELLSDAVPLPSPSDDINGTYKSKVCVPVWCSIAFSTGKIFVFWSIEHHANAAAVAAHPPNGGVLRSYSTNGTLISSLDISRKDAISSFSVSSDEKCIFLGTASGFIRAIDAKQTQLCVLHSLRAFSSLKITSVRDVGDCLFAGLEDGKLCVWT